MSPSDSPPDYRVCTICGAVVPGDDRARQHQEWHDKLTLTLADALRARRAELAAKQRWLDDWAAAEATPEFPALKG